MGRFEVLRVTAEISGGQEFAMDVHVVTKHGKPTDMITVTLGGMMVYIHDLAAARAFATAWRKAESFVPVGMPQNTAVHREMTSCHISECCSGSMVRRCCSGSTGSARVQARTAVRMCGSS